MPEISRFYGIVITMYALDHPPPHLHARYAEHQAVITIADSRVIVGELPARAARMVKEWIALHREELEIDWNLVRTGGSPLPVPPLP